MLNHKAYFVLTYGIPLVSGNIVRSMNVSNSHS